MNNKQAALIAAASTFSGVTLSHDDGETISQEERDATVLQTAERFLDWLDEGEEYEPLEDLCLYEIGEDDYEEYPIGSLRIAVEERQRIRQEDVNVDAIERMTKKEMAEWLRLDDVENPRS